MIIGAIVISFAAISYGFLLGSVFNTHHQALMFGAISIIMMSAIGGIWIPIEVLPAMIQKLGNLSPLHWGLALLNDLFLRNFDLQQYLFKCLILLAFGGICLLISYRFSRKII